MHYLNGREAKVGDKIFVPGNQHEQPFTGIIVEAVAGEDTCNLQVVPLPASIRYVTASAAMHVDDVKAVEPAQPAE